VAIKANITTDKEGTEPLLYEINIIYDIYSSTGKLSTVDGGSTDDGYINFFIANKKVSDYKNITVLFTDPLSNGYYAVPDTWVNNPKVDTEVTLMMLISLLKVGDKLSGFIKLVDKINNVGVSNENLKLTVSSVVYDNVKTDDNGIYNLSNLDYVFKTPGISAIGVMYGGNEMYNPCYAAYDLTIKDKTNIGLDDVKASYRLGDNLSGIINLTRGDGVGFIGALNISINNESFNVITNDSGEFNLSELNYMFNNNGDFNLTVNYEGYSLYAPSNNSKMLKVVRFTPPVPPIPNPTPHTPNSTHNDPHSPTVNTDSNLDKQNFNSLIEDLLNKEGKGNTLPKTSIPIAGLIGLFLFALIVYPYSRIKK
jgi:hypothetical protein